MFLGIAILFLSAFAFRRYRQRNTNQVPVTAVQMGPAGGYYSGSSAPQGYGGGAQPGVYYNTAGGAPPAYAGAWGAQQPAGYPPSGGGASRYGGMGGGGGVGGYGSQPLSAMAPPAPHQPAPMTTVTLGMPHDGDSATGGNGGSSFYPQPSSGGAAGGGPPTFFFFLAASPSAPAGGGPPPGRPPRPSLRALVFARTTLLRDGWTKKGSERTAQHEHPAPRSSTARPHPQASAEAARTHP